MTPVSPLLGTVAGLWRYPVKSLGGERLETARVEARGVAGDRLWAVREPDGKLGSGKSTRRFRRMDGLLDLVARYDGDVPVVAFPDGSVRRGDDAGIGEALSAYVGRPVALAREDGVSHFDEGPLHLVTAASLQRLAQAHEADVDPRRLRPNLLLDTGGGAGLLEEGWVGYRLTVGSQVVLEVRARMPRCVMTNAAQRDLPADRGVLRTLTGLSEGHLGVVVDVVAAGVVRLGDPVRIADAD